MWGLFLGFAGGAGSRLVGLLWLIALWLISRPGGWAVLVAAVLVGLKLWPAPTGIAP